MPKPLRGGSSPKKGCVFCAGTVDATTKPQHIIQACLGGTLSTKETTCTTCNEEFSCGVDLVVAEKFQRFLNALGPALKAGGPTIAIPGAVEKLAPGLVPVRKAAAVSRKDGKTTIVAADASHARKVLKSLGRTDLLSTLRFDVELSEGRLKARAMTHHHDEFRSAAKTCLEYVCLREPMAIAAADILPIVRLVNLNDQTRPPKCWYLKAPTELATKFNEKVPPTPFCHRMVITFGPEGIHGYLLLFGSVGYRVEITSNPQKESKSLLYQKNILKNAPTDSTLKVPGVFFEGAFLPISLSVVAKAQGESLRDLYLAALWHAEVECRDHVLDQYRKRLLVGARPGDQYTVDGAQIVEILWDRLQGIFSMESLSTDARRESQRIKDEVGRKLAGKKWSEQAPTLNSTAGDVIWPIHVQTMRLHKHYVGLPTFGFRSFGSQIERL